MFNVTSQSFNKSKSFLYFMEASSPSKSRQRLCKHCHGFGIILTWKMKDQKLTYDFVTCPYCKGRGYQVVRDF